MTRFDSRLSVRHSVVGVVGIVDIVGLSSVVQSGQFSLGNEIERVVTWKQGSDVSALSGKSVRLRFSIKDADLYSFKFNE